MKQINIRKLYQFLILGPLFSMTLNAQEEPALIHVTEGGRTPEVFALAYNYFTFEHDSPVTGAVILSDTSQWHIEWDINNTYLIRCKQYSRSKPVDLDSTVQLMLRLQNGDSVKMIAPVRPYADVKVLARSSVDGYSTDSLLNCDDKVSFRALWVYPPYVKKRWRVLVVLDMEVIANGEHISGFTGWYDSGDATKFQELAAYKEMEDVQFRVRQIRTLHRFQQNVEWKNVELSEEYPNVWYLRCE